MLGYGITLVERRVFLKLDVAKKLVHQTQYSYKQGIISFPLNYCSIFQILKSEWYYESPWIKYVSPDTQIQPFWHISLISDWQKGVLPVQLKQSDLCNKNSQPRVAMPFENHLWLHQLVKYDNLLCQQYHFSPIRGELPMTYYNLITAT